MDISVYFEAVDLEKIGFYENLHSQKLGKQVFIHQAEAGFPDFETADIAIFGVSEDRSAFNNEGCALGADYIRKYLYRLFKGNYSPKIVDLGNILRGHEVKDTYYAASSVIAELLKSNTIPVIIGGGQDLTYANYLAYEQLGKISRPAYRSCCNSPRGS